MLGNTFDRWISCVALGVWLASSVVTAQQVRNGGDANPAFPEAVPDLRFLEPQQLNISKRVADGSILFPVVADEFGLELWRHDPADGSVSLVKDIRLGSSSGFARSRFVVPPLYFSSDPYDLIIELNGLVYFVGASFETVELWRTDGTRQGTFPFTNLTEQAIEFQLPPVVAGDTIYFVGYNAVTGSVLYALDETNGEVAEVFAFDPGGEPIAFNQLVASGHDLVLAGTTDDAPVWLSDGTTEGTRVLQAAPANAESFRTVAGKLYFHGTTAATGTEPWVSDLTESGTFMLGDFLPGPESSARARISGEWAAAVGDQVFVLASDETTLNSDLYVTRGTPGTTEHVVDLNSLLGDARRFGIVSLGDYALISGTSEFVRIDANSVSLLDGPQLFGNREIQPVEGAGFGYFRGYEPQTGLELWRTDGTPEGTFLVEDIDPRPEGFGSSPTVFTQIDGIVYFFARRYISLDPFSDIEEPLYYHGLWSVDPQTDAVAALTLGDTATASSHPGGFTRANGWVVFHGDSLLGREMFRTDGFRSLLLPDTEYAFFSRVDATLNTLGSTPEYAFFAADIPEPTLWATDGQSSQELAAIRAPSIEGGALGRQFVFAGGVDDVELWRSDGTEEGTLPLGDLNPLRSSYPRQFVASGNVLYFTAINSRGRELWATQGEPFNTFPLADLEPGPGSSLPSHLTDVDGTLYFLATTSAAGQELFKTDGSPEGTRLVVDLAPGPDSADISELTALGDRLYFLRDTNDSTVLVRTDGTAAGTHAIFDFNAGDVVEPGNLFAAGDALYFTAWTQETGRELWTSDGTTLGTRMVADLEPGPAGSLPVRSEFQGAGGLSVFRFVATVHSRQELYETDGTVEGTRQISDFDLPGQKTIRNLTAIDEDLWFSGFDPRFGFEPFVARLTEPVRPAIPPRRAAPTRDVQIRTEGSDDASSHPQGAVSLRSGPQPHRRGSCRPGVDPARAGRVDRWRSPVEPSSPA